MSANTPEEWVTIDIKEDDGVVIPMSPKRRAWFMEMSKRTAMSRKEPSLPVRFFYNAYTNYSLSLPLDIKVLDYGTGYGTDYMYLKDEGIDVWAYDFNFKPFDERPDQKFDVVLCTYVLNTLPKHLRAEVIADTAGFVKESGLVIFSVRSITEMASVSKEWEIFQDGFLTKAETFQRFYSHGELAQELLDSNYYRNTMVVKTDPVIVIATTPNILLR